MYQRIGVIHLCKGSISLLLVVPRMAWYIGNCSCLLLRIFLQQACALFSCGASGTSTWCRLLRRSSRLQQSLWRTC